MVVKDFSASDWATGASAANAEAAIRTNTTESAVRDFIFSVLLILFFSFSFGCGNLFGIVGLYKSLQAGKVRLPQLRKYELAI